MIDNTLSSMSSVREMAGALILGLIAIILLSTVQTFLKIGLNNVGGFSLADGLSSLLNVLTSNWIIIGLACYGLITILWLDVLSKLDFSLAFPMMGLTYVFTLFIGHFVFHETIGGGRIFGVILILFGLFFLVRSGTSG